MLAVRIAFSNPDKIGERAAFLEAHKAYLRNANIHILQSGPFTSLAGGFAGALIIAEVESLTHFKDFSDADPFVANGIYATAHIVAWSVTMDRMVRLC